MGLAKNCDRCFWAKNDGAIVKVCQNRAFLEHFFNILGQFSRKVARFLQKLKEIERFLKLLKKEVALLR
ncbi:MAG: hypothetical protein IID32_03555 [Planctomycetes bacterium]|nr:hypothetical protein [Planctomycetota bacterium]